MTTTGLKFLWIINVYCFKASKNPWERKEKKMKSQFTKSKLPKWQKAQKKNIQPQGISTRCQLKWSK